ncbi:MAG: DUF4367 domain-containing protein, partial [Clostridia bacterium]|nr:DUF4367 domain-containing protein [Clostridia bacterium]
LVSSAIGMSIHSFRIKVFEFIVDVFQPYSIVTIDDLPHHNIENAPATIRERYVPAYLPEGYILVEDIVADVSISSFYAFTGPLDEISFIQSTKASYGSLVNTEDADIVEITLHNGLQGFYCHNRGIYIMVLHNTDYAFSIVSAIEFDELIKFAESLSPEVKK